MKGLQALREENEPASALTAFFCSTFVFVFAVLRRLSGVHSRFVSVARFNAFLLSAFPFNFK